MARPLRRLQDEPAGPRDPRHQDAAHGRHGDAAALRQKSDLPVIFLTSKDEEIDELFGLKMGADELHPQTVLAAPSGGARQGVLRRAVPKDPAGARRRWTPGAGARRAAHGPGAPHLHLEESSR